MKKLDIHVHNIGSYIVKNYLLETPQGIIAIDTGYPGGMDTFRRRFEKKWPLSRLAYIFLTHHHDDHAGFLADLLAETQAKLVLHAKALPPLAQGKSYDPPEGGYSSFPASLFGKFKKDFVFPPVVPKNRAIVLHSEQDQVFQALGLPIQIIFLPGHTADSIGLYLPRTGQLFCGDAAMNAVISRARHTIWIDDKVEFGKSWDKMLALHPARIYPAHGAPFSPKDLLKFRHYMDHRSLIRPDKG